MLIKKLIYEYIPYYTYISIYIIIIIIYYNTNNIEVFC